MNRLAFVFLVVVVPLSVFFASDASAQTAQQLRKDRLRGELGIQRAAIGEQAVQRQTEVARLERLLEQMDSRLMRLERQLLTATSFPAITIGEAEATLEFSEQRLQESLQQLDAGAITDTQVARNRLSVAQARGQMQVAVAAHTESLLILELAVLAAERQLRQETQQKTQLERLVAKGYASSEGLQLQLIDVDAAEKQLQIAKLRLETQRKLSPPQNDSTNEKQSTDNE